MNNCIRQYKKALKKNLRCTRNTKNQLMQKFESTLSVFWEDKPNPTMEEVCVAFGPPKEMASILMEEVTTEETARYRKNSIIVRSVIGVLIGAILFLSVAISIQLYLYKEKPIIYDDEVIVDEVDESSDDIIVEDDIVIED